MPVPQVEAAPSCSTTPNPNHSAASDVAQTAIRFRNRIAGRELHSRPPDHGIWNDSARAMVTSADRFHHASRKIARGAMGAYLGKLYLLSTRDSRTDRRLVDTTHGQMATELDSSDRHVQAMEALATKWGMIRRLSDPRRGSATRTELLPGGLSWRAARDLYTVTAAAVVSIEDRGTPPPTTPPPTPPPLLPDRPVRMTGPAGPPLGVRERSRTTTTARGAAELPPPSPKQLRFAADLGVNVADLDVTAAGQVIEIARFERIAAARTATTARIQDLEPPQRRQRRHRPENDLTPAQHRDARMLHRWGRCGDGCFLCREEAV